MAKMKASMVMVNTARAHELFKGVGTRRTTKDLEWMEEWINMVDIVAR